MEHIACETRIYRFTGLQPLLASQPADKELHSKFIAGKIAKQNIEKAMEEEAMFAQNPVFTKNEPLKDENGENIEKYSEGSAFSIFLTNPKEEGNPICLMSSHIMGFLKDALLSCEAQLGVKNERSKVDRYVAIRTPYLTLMRNGKPIGVPDGELERTLRTQARMGIPPMTALKKSQYVDEGWYVDVPLTLLPNRGTPASEPLTWEKIETALEYGIFHGLGEWRNSCFVGQFTVERLKDDGKWSLLTDLKAQELWEAAAKAPKKGKKTAKKTEEETNE